MKVLDEKSKGHQKHRGLSLSSLVSAASRIKTFSVEMKKTMIEFIYWIMP